MKNDPITTLLNFVLAVLVVLCVVFEVWATIRTSELKQMQTTVQAQLQKTQFDMSRAQALLNEVKMYNNTAKNQELAQIIQSAETAPTPAK